MPPQQGQIDNDALDLAKSIRDNEGGNNYYARGKSGESGAGQWMPDTWKAHAQEALGNPAAPMTPENQKVVLYTIVKKRKDAGFNPAQIAAEWNSGSAEGWENKRGINDFGVAYDVPAYVKKVTDSYQKYKGQNGTITSTNGQQNTTVPPLLQAPEQDDKQLSTIGKVLEFAFPILEDKPRTGKQLAGDIALSALWFVPGLGGAASAGLRAAGLGAKAARTTGLIGTGAATGYGADVATSLSENKGVAEALKPGLGTVLGAGGGAVGARLASKYSPTGIVEGIAKGNNAVFGQTKRGANELHESLTRGKDPGKLAAEKGINLKQLIDPETIGYNTKESAAKVVKDASALNEVLTDALARVPGNRSVAELEAELLAKIPKNYPERADVVRKEMELLRKQYGDMPSAADLNEWKQRNWNLGKFDMAVPNDTRLTHRLIGNTLKTNVEDLAKKGGLKGVDEMNEYIGSHFDLADNLDSLHGLKAKGGRLGDMMRTRGMEMVGAATGVFGGGVPGMLAGMIAGHYGGKALNKAIRAIESSPIKSAILRRLVKEDPEIVKKMIAASGKTPKELEPLKNQLKELGIDIFPEAKTGKIAPKLNVGPKLSPRLAGEVPPKSAERAFESFTNGTPQKGVLQRAKDFYESIPNKQGGFIKVPTPEKAFKNFNDLSTKLLSRLEGKTTVSKQFIQDLTNSPDLKQPEKDLFRELLKGEGDKISVKDFANKVKSELLPLERGNNTRHYGNQYENITLPDELRGPVANYRENIYKSPIKTSAGQVHFGGSGNMADNYFAHSRIEDLPDQTALSRSDRAAITKRMMAGENIGQPPLGKNQGGTRRVIELQSDLFQRGRLEGEKASTVKAGLHDPTALEFIRKELTPEQFDDYVNNRAYLSSSAKSQILDKIRPGLSDEIKAKVSAVEKAETDSRLKELAPLEPYRNTWHERVIREEIKQAAKDGKTKLQFPTGETAMKIEGLGQGNDRWSLFYGNDVRGLEGTYAGILEPGDIKIGALVSDYADDKWIITDVLGDGKFKAVSKSTWGHNSPKELAKIPENAKETFDISGKVDTNNPIYKFYEKEVGKYLKNKFGATRITDPQGVEWWEVPVSKEQKKLPIEAFGVGAGLIPLSSSITDKKER